MRGSFSLIATYGAAHALVDASCAALVFSAASAGRMAPSTALVAVLAYNLLAFASQPLLGWFLTNQAHGRGAVPKPDRWS